MPDPDSENFVPEPLVNPGQSTDEHIRQINEALQAISKALVKMSKAQVAADGRVDGIERSVSEHEREIQQLSNAVSDIAVMKVEQQGIKEELGRTTGALRKVAWTVISTVIAAVLGLVVYKAGPKPEPQPIIIQMEKPDGQSTQR